MTRDFAETCSITSASIQDGRILITVMNDVLADQNVQHSVLLHLEDSRWEAIRGDKVLPFPTAAVCPAGDRDFMLVGWGGQALLVSPEGSSRFKIARTGLPYAPIRACKNVGGFPTAAGSFRHVYRFRDYRWDAIDAGVASASIDPLIGFEAIGGYSPDELYAAGLGGELWRMNGRGWNKIEAPTNVDLQCIECTPAGVFVGGRSGVLLNGRFDTWSLTDVDLAGTIWQTVLFGGRLLIFTDDAVAILRGSNLELVDKKVLPDQDFHTAIVDNGRLWSFGSKSIFTFDGSVWSRVGTEPSEHLDEDVAVFLDNRVVETGSKYLPQS